MGETGSVILDEDTGTRTNLTFSVLRMTKMGFVPDAVWSESTGYMKSRGKFRQFLKSLFRLSVNFFLIFKNIMLLSRGCKQWSGSVRPRGVAEAESEHRERAERPLHHGQAGRRVRGQELVLQIDPSVKLYNHGEGPY